MNDYNDDYISPNWTKFRRLWWIVAIILFLLVLLLWLMGLGRFGWGERNAACLNSNTDIQAESSDHMTRLATLEKENQIIPDLNAQIKQLQGQVTTIPQLEGKIADLQGLLSAKSADGGQKADTESPVLKILGDNPVSIDLGGSFTDLGVEAKDNADGTIKIVKTGEVNSQKAGWYQILYTATDASGNTATTSRFVHVVEPKSAEQKTSQSATTGIAQARVFFDLNSSTVNSTGRLYLSPVIAFMKANTSSKVSLSGFHDPSGNAAANAALAKSRANAVKDILVNAGISADRIELTKPVETTGSGIPAEARRVELTITN